METRPSVFLVPTDFTDAAHSATRFAMELAKEPHDQVILLHIISNDRQRIDAERQIASFEKEYTGKGINITSKVVAGKLSAEIEEVTKILDVDLIVLGTHCITGIGKVFRSHAFKIVEDVSVPLIIVQEETSFTKIKKIVMTIDLERESVQIVSMAAKIGKKFGAEIILVAKEQTEEMFKQRRDINLQVCHKILTEKDIAHRVEFVDGNDFIRNIFELCKREEADLLAATYYQQHIHVFTESFVQTLAYNDFHIPLLTMDEESTHSGTQFGAMWG
jgi:nucleotide-binding universal stress UspA family protein